MSMIYTAKDLEKLLGDSVSKATAEIIKARREASTERGRDIKQVVGDERHVSFHLTDHTEPTPSAKYLYTISRVE